MNRQSSLLARVAGAILLTTASIGTIAMLLSEQIVEGQRHQDLLRRAELVAATQADALSGFVWEMDNRSAQRMIEALTARDPAIRSIAVFETDRKQPLARTAVGEIAGKTAEKTEDANGIVTVERPILLHGREGRVQTVGHLRIAYSTAEVRQATLDALIPVAGLLLLSLLGAMAALGLTLNRMVLRPLRRLTQLASAMARGEYGARMDAGRSDEIGVLADGFNRMAATVQDHTSTLESRVRDRTEALAAINRAIMDSINYAQLIQSAILPSAGTLSAGLTEHFVLWRPRDVVSGDFYVCREVEDGFVVAVADCTGHGVPGAFMTMTASAILNNVLDQLGAADPAAVLAAVDRKVRAALHQEEEARGGAACFDNGLDLGLCHIRPAEGKLVFAGARIPLLVVADGSLTELRGDRRSLGYRPSAFRTTGSEPVGYGAESPFTNQSIALRPGQTFLMGTDGLVDQNGGERGRSFGRIRLHELLSQGAHSPLDRLKTDVESSLDRFQCGREQRDDITLFGFRVRLTDAVAISGTGSGRRAA
ncbi:SpoIIE family protein phosphatase [Azospirillum melinis]|uniref:SpoIIE family protein phosphatase n=1 Tax=Azospirillum melinis TaxID=328839 RepID=A0ABX2K740_9PROT|nr:SpoIIE family protein phosphatase [Azospirillum melinis]MBP2304014.1 serine phosphatase RsbU (regulator of sigma subunit)/HAMP domain-containing protein [Azospirillum melinis]NUA98380.1 SpoIIE family protein phosphatase [Azospirillum melinis]